MQTEYKLTPFQLAVQEMAGEVEASFLMAASYLTVLGSTLYDSGYPSQSMRLLEIRDVVEKLTESFNRTMPDHL